jgi:23S rRNA pseudouridine2604 synthase
VTASRIGALDMARATLKLPPRVAPATQPKPPTSRARRAQHGRTRSVAPDPIALRVGHRQVATSTASAPSTVTRAQVTPPVAEITRAAAADHEHPRLSKRMSELGLCSRREADEWIENGWVTVDGVIVTALGTRVRPDAHIAIDSAARRHQSQQVTILLNKPIGYVSGQAEDGYQPASVLIRAETRWPHDRAPLEFRPSQLRGLAPAGRLDIDSTGLLVFTQDGRVARRLIGSDSEVEKEYLVRVEGKLSPAGLAQLQHGLALDGVPLKPARVSWQNEHQLRLVLREGRKRQIRRMCELVGLVVTGLKRVRTGSVVLGKLPMGQWRYLRPDEKF